MTAEDQARQTYSVGVDLGGTNLRIASYVGGLSFLDSVTIPTRLLDGPGAVVEDMCSAISALVRNQEGERRLSGVAVGTPGPLELPEGVLHNPPNLPGWDGFNLREALESRLRRPVLIESDANLAALAEQRLGAGETHAIDSLCVLTLGTGVGSGLILNGEIWHGATGMGGEAGHIVVRETNGAPCGCGGHGCLEQYASASAITRMAYVLMGEEAPRTAQQVAKLALAGDRDAATVFDGVGRSLAIALTGLINTLNLPLYLLGGGACDAWKLFAPAMFRELQSRSYVYRLTEPDDLEPAVLERHKTYILRAELGSTAGLLGACLYGLAGSENLTSMAL